MSSRTVAAFAAVAALAALCTAEPSGLGGIGGGFKKGYEDGYDEKFGAVNKYQGGAGGEFDKAFFEKGGQNGEKGYKG